MEVSFYLSPRLNFDHHGFYSKADIFSSKEFKNSEYRPDKLENVIFNGKDGSIAELVKETGMWINQQYLFANNKRLYTIYDFKKWW